jgi:hypothetical protein
VIITLSNTIQSSCFAPPVVSPSEPDQKVWNRAAYRLNDL